MAIPGIVSNYVLGGYFLAQRAAIAFLAISLRRVGDRFRARANPPLDAPSLDKATAAGFFGLSEGSMSSACPVEISPISLASWNGSRGRFGRVAMPYFIPHHPA